MQEIEHDEAPELLLAHSIVFEAMRSNVTGYKQSPLGTHAFEGVDIQVGPAPAPSEKDGAGRSRSRPCSPISSAASR